MANDSAAQTVAQTMPAGRPPETNPEDALEVFDERDDPAEPLTASEVDDRLDCSKRTTLRQLEQLVEDGELKSKEVGARAKVWWIPLDDRNDHQREPQPAADDVERREVPPTEPPLEDAPAPGDRHEIGEEAADAVAEQETDEEGESVGEDLRDEVRENLPGSGDTLEARVDAVLDLYNYLREQEGQIRTTSELKELIDADDVGYGSVGSFWSNGVKANSNVGRDNALTALPGVEELGNGRYRYHADK